MSFERRSLRRRLESVRSSIRKQAERARPNGDPAADARVLDVDEFLLPSRVPADHFAPGFDGGAIEDLRRHQTGDADVMFFDLETTGLGLRARIFLTGCLYWEGTGLRLHQEFASDLPQEREVLDRLRTRIERRPRLVTYNGRSFDVPLLRRRLSFHSLPPLPDSLVVEDLLHRTRRAHGKGLPNCRLGTVERLVLGKLRGGQDVSGAEAPLRFQDFLATGRRDLLDPVVYHNRIDLTTLAGLRWLLDRDERRANETQAETAPE